MILLELSPGERRYRPVSTAEEFKQKTGISPVMKDVGVSCYCQKDDCLCQIDAKSTAVEANLTFDIGDKHDYHSCCFTYDLKIQIQTGRVKLAILLVKEGEIIFDFILANSPS